MYVRTERKGVLIREVPSFGIKMYVRTERKSLLERCPYSGVL